MADKIFHELIYFDDDKFPVKIDMGRTLNHESHLKLSNSLWHEELEIKYFIKGGAVIECDSQFFIAEDGDIVIINPGERHDTCYLKGSPEYNMIIIDVRFLQSSGKDLSDIKYISPFIESRIKFNNLIKSNTYLKEILLKIFDELKRKEDAYELLCKGLFFMFFASLFRSDIKLIKNKTPLNSYKKNYSRINPAFEYINKNFTSDIKLEKLAELCNISSYHFCRLFKKLTTISPIKYINEYRINRAELLLKTSDFSVTQISYSVGFKDESYFSRCFKQSKGISPSEYRKKILAQEL